MVNASSVNASSALTEEETRECKSLADSLVEALRYAAPELWPAKTAHYIESAWGRGRRTRGYDGLEIETPTGVDIYIRVSRELWREFLALRERLDKRPTGAGEAILALGAWRHREIIIAWLHSLAADSPLSPLDVAARLLRGEHVRWDEARKKRRDG